MTQIQTLAFSALIAGSALLQGCIGGKGGQPITQSMANTVLEQFKSSVGQSMPSNNNVPTMPVAGVSASSRSAKVTGCETITPNPVVDSDNDGIADEKIYTFDCTSLSSGGTTYTQKGTVKIQDVDNAVSGMMGGIRVEFDMPVFSSDDGDGKYEYSYKGFWDYSREGDSLISSSEFTGSTKYAHSGFQNDYTYTYTWDYKLTPDNPSNATYWNGGAIEFKGDFELSGDFIVEDGNSNQTQRTGTWVIKYYSKDLVLKSGCTQMYDSGSIFMEDGNGIFEIRYECNDAKLFLNGVESDWWDPA